jgi:hypothetical protein
MEWKKRAGKRKGTLLFLSFLCGCFLRRPFATCAYRKALKGNVLANGEWRASGATEGKTEGEISGRRERKRESAMSVFTIAYNA